MGSEGRLTGDELLRRLRAGIFENAPDSIYFYSLKDNRLLDVNPEMEKALGYTREELLQMTAADFHLKEEPEHLCEKEVTVKGKGVFKEKLIHHHRRKDGTLLPVQCASMLLTVDGQNIIQVIFHDVSELVRVEQELKERTMILQKSLLPSSLPDIEGLEIATFYESATEAALVGGDFYDVLPIDDNLTVFAIGDVSGKGIEAAATTSMVRNTIRAFAFQNPDPAFVMTGANSIVARQLESGMFITLLYFLYNRETGEISLVNAGHPYPIFCPPGQGGCFEFEGANPAFGVIPDYVYRPQSITFTNGAILALYTDGLIEARRDGEFFGVERVKRVFNANPGISAHRLAEMLVDECHGFAGGRLTDDIAVVVLKRT